MLRAIVLLILYALISRHRVPHDADTARLAVPQFQAGTPTAYPPPIDADAPLPEVASIAAIINDSTPPYRYHRVIIRGYYTIDPSHGSVLVDSSGRGLMLFGGSDDIGDQPFDWTRQKVCGTFVVMINRKPMDGPLQYLCGEVCAVGKGTVASMIAAINR